MKRILLIALVAVMSLGMSGCVEEHIDAIVCWGVGSYSGGYNDEISAAWKTLENTFDDTFSAMGEVDDHCVVIHDANVNKLSKRALKLAESADAKLDKSTIEALSQLDVMVYRVYIFSPDGTETPVWQRDYAQGK